MQALVELVSKCQALKTAWQGDSLQALIETIGECQALQTAWQGHSFKRLLDDTISSLRGSFTPSKLWPKQLPNVKFCRLLGSFTPSKLWLKLSSG